MKEQQAATRQGIRIMISGDSEGEDVCLARLQLLDFFKSSSRTRATTPLP